MADSMDEKILNAALDYYRRGFSPIPIKLMDKRPLRQWTEFQKIRPTESEIMNWFHDGGANIGIITGMISNLIVVDLDDEEAHEYFRNNNFPESPAAKTFRGTHIYYKCNSSVKTTTHINNLKIDIRAEGGYVVAPPSIHEKGVKYEWIEGYGLDDLPIADFPVELLAAKKIQNKENTIVELYSGVLEGQRNVSLARLMGSWLKDGLAESECLEMAFIWNSRNFSPLPDAEVVTTVTGIYKRYADNKVSIPTKLTSLKDLLDEPEEILPWVVKDMLPFGGSSIITAKPKVGKSTIVRQGMLNVARGELFLNRETIAGSIIYLALEEKRSEIRRHFRDMGATGKESIFISTSIGKEEPISTLRKMIEEVNAIWVIIDPLFKFINVKDGNAYSEMSKAIEPIHAVARDLNVHVTMIHHSTKGDRPGGDGILGSSAIFGGIDTAIILKNNDGKRTIYTIQRYGVDIPESVLVFDKTTRVTSLGASQAATVAVSLEQKIIGFLSIQNQPISENAINENIGGDGVGRSSALRNLVASGTIVRTGAGKKGNPFLYAIKKETVAPVESAADDGQNQDFNFDEPYVDLLSDDPFKPVISEGDEDSGNILI